MLQQRRARLRSTRSRMRRPPSHVSRSSSRSRPRDAVADRAALARTRSRGHARRTPRCARVHAGVSGPPPGRSRARRSASLHLARHVQAAGAPVAAEVLPEVRELQRRAQRVRRSIERLVAIAGDPQHEPADRIGRAAAVVEHVGPRGVASRRDILTERAHEIVEERQRQIERSDRVAERDEQSARRALGGGDRRALAGDRVVQAAAARRRSRACRVGRRRRRLRRRCRRPLARTRTRPRHAAASAPAAGARRRENSRSATAPAPRTRRTRAASGSGLRNTDGILTNLNA